MINTLPANVKSLFPKENLEFADSITENESKILKEVISVCYLVIHTYKRLTTMFYVNSGHMEAQIPQDWYSAPVQCINKVFDKHACFEQVGEMIDAVEKKSPELGKRMRTVLAGNCARLEGLSPAAVEYSKKCVHFITHVMCSLTLGKQLTFDKADELHKEFKELSAADQAALKKANPDVQF
ncbi:hypothetical protein Y032_0064g3538 [Ancylostoma ceylanicum]|uniref:Uncharacterized protein n=1 Tax=Ancylostoma ceylanicum TaxID=53326 RepID=A0A016U0F0_9BILA|nr:hypothetical protein Y032_0064g3538 [Ancylostoma ceylanicum]